MLVVVGVEASPSVSSRPPLTNWSGTGLLDVVEPVDVVLLHGRKSPSGWVDRTLLGACRPQRRHARVWLHEEHSFLAATKHVTSCILQAVGPGRASSLRPQRTTREEFIVSGGAGMLLAYALIDVGSRRKRRALTSFRSGSLLLRPRLSGDSLRVGSVTARASRHRTLYTRGHGIECGGTGPYLHD